MSLNIKWHGNSKCWKSQYNPNSIACFFKKYWLLDDGTIVRPDIYYNEVYLIDVDENYKHIDDPFEAMIVYYNYRDRTDEKQYVRYAIMQSDSYDELNLYRRLEMGYTDQF
jgi:hypothetical protein